MKRSKIVQSKSQVKSMAGILTAQSIAAEAGGEIFELGGNAIDAAIAASFVACSIEPSNATLGGGGAALVYHAETGSTYAIEFNGRLPMGMREDMFVDDLLPLGEDQPPFRWRGTRDRVAWKGYRTLGVPGQVGGLCMLHEKFGSLPLADLVAPAIRICEEGWEVDARYQYYIAQDMEWLQKFPSIAELLLPGGRVPVIRDFYRSNPTIIKQPRLAETLRAVANGGADAFYRGEVARKIIEDVVPHGAAVTLEDYAAYAPKLYEDGIRTKYKGYDIVCMPDAYGGVTVIETLNILDGIDLAAMGHNQPETVHTIIEALRLAWADRFYHMGDPEFEEVPIQGLISKDYADARRQLIGSTVPSSIEPGNPWDFQAVKPTVNAGAAGPHHNSQDTTHISAMDGRGNTISLVHSAGGSFGAMVVSQSTGILQRNYTNLFNPEPGTRNSLGPWKRPLSHDSLTLVFKEGKPFITIGAPGGRRVITSVVQAIVNVIDFGMNMQDAIGAPRIHAEGSDPKFPAGLVDPNVIADTRYPATVIEDLERRGHRVTLLPDGDFASPVAVMRDPVTGEMSSGLTVPTPARAIGI